MSAPAAAEPRREKGRGDAPERPSLSARQAAEPRESRGRCCATGEAERHDVHNHQRRRSRGEKKGEAMPGKAEPFRTVGGGAAGEQSVLLRGVRDEQKVKEPHGRGGRYFGQRERIAVTSARVSATD